MFKCESEAAADEFLRRPLCLPDPFNGTFSLDLSLKKTFSILHTNSTDIRYCIFLFSFSKWYSPRMYYCNSIHFRLLTANLSGNTDSLQNDFLPFKKHLTKKYGINKEYLK